MNINLSSYYTGLLTSEYANSPKIQTWLSALLSPLNDITGVSASFDSFFDIDAAEGIQLDLLGMIIGQDRTVNFQPSGGVSPTLDDTTYRLVLKAKVGFNQWTGKIGDIYPLWKAIFPGGQIIFIDNQNMTLTVTVSGAFISIIKDLITNGYIVPRSQGVLMNYTFTTLPLFGADRDDSYVAGADTGHAE